MEAKTQQTTQQTEEEFGIIPIGLGLTLQKDINELKHQYGLFNVRLDKVETKIETTVAGVIRNSQSTGWFSGDVGFASVIGIVILLGIGLVSYFQYQIQKLKKSLNV